MTSSLDRLEKSLNTLATTLESPYYTFHGRIVNTFSALPRKSKVKEVATRIMVVAVSPLCYPISIALLIPGKFLRFKNIAYNVDLLQRSIWD